MLTRLPYVVQLASLIAVYFLAGKLGLSFAFVNSSASAVWPPTGIAIAALLLFGRRLWPAVFIGAFLVNATTAGPMWTSTTIALGNTLEAVIGVALVQRFAGGAVCFDRSHTLFWFVVCAGVLGTAVSASVGVVTLVLSGNAQWSEFEAIWITWWLGDAVGALAISPLIVLWLRPQPAYVRTARLAPLVLSATVVAVGTVVFAGGIPSGYPMAFLCLPPLVWAAFRFGPRHVALSIVTLMVIATWGTLRGLGPFALQSQQASLLVLQAFMGTAAIMILAISVLVREREQAAHLATAASVARDEALAMLSHELRNPLQAITSATALLRHGTQDRDTVEQATRTISRQTEHLARLVNDLLDVSRAIEGKTVLVREPVNLDLAIKQCLATVGETGQTQHHQISVEAQPVWVHADPIRVQQILRNLIVNALTYTPAGGAVRIRALRAGQTAVIEVVDEGLGISPRLLPRIFELFSQGERDLDRRLGGLGIGLTLVRRLVEQHGGTVTAESAGEGRGSRFTVRLPAIEGPAATAQPAPPPAVVAGAKRILIVEDNDDARETLRTLLEMLGYEVETAVDGPAGVEAALRVRPDVALVDIGLPRLDGYGVARELRQYDANLRLVAMTGYSGEQDRANARSAGFDDHLVKPVKIEELERALASTAPRGSHW